MWAQNISVMLHHQLNRLLCDTSLLQIINRGKKIIWCCEWKRRDETLLIFKNLKKQSENVRKSSRKSSWVIFTAKYLKKLQPEMLEKLLYDFFVTGAHKQVDGGTTNAFSKTFVGCVGDGIFSHKNCPNHKHWRWIRSFHHSEKSTDNYEMSDSLANSEGASYDYPSRINAWTTELLYFLGQELTLHLFNLSKLLNLWLKRSDVVKVRCIGFQRRWNESKDFNVAQWRSAALDVLMEAHHYTKIVELKNLRWIMCLHHPEKSTDK